MKLGLILTNDWELFGNGSGDFDRIQREPLRRLLAVVEEHRAKLTIMAEIGQQWAHRKLAESEPWALKVCTGWEQALQEAVGRGHDVQLHLHSQWLESRYDGERWTLDLAHWLNTSLPQDRLTQILIDGREYLERLLQPIEARYHCFAFRAGAFGIEPSARLLRALEDAGFVGDTSVVKGLHHPEGFFDYRRAPSSYRPWIVSADDMLVPDPSRLDGLLELPVFSLPPSQRSIWHVGKNVLRKASFYRRERAWFRRKAEYQERYYPTAQRASVLSSEGRSSEAQKHVNWLRLDYDELSALDFLDALRSVAAANPAAEDVIYPVVATGHVKAMPDGENMQRVLSLLQRKMSDKIVFWTLTEAIRYWRNRFGRRNQGDERDA